jgi:hypothetical protein
MAGYLFAELVAGFFLFVLLRYGIARIAARRDLALVAAFAAFMVLALLVSGLGLLAHAAELGRLAETRPLSSREDLLNWEGSGPAVVAARIDPETPAALEDYVAYVESEGFDWRPALDLVLDDGSRVSAGGDYDPANWEYVFDTSFVKAGDPVVVIGRPQRFTPTGGDGPDQGVDLQAEVVFRGRYEDFREEYLPGQRIESGISLALAAVSGAAALIVSVLALARIGRSWREMTADR